MKEKSMFQLIKEWLIHLLGGVTMGELYGYDMESDEDDHS